ncbi:hypothetical protein FA95DRAFT_1564557 [Auriscalpium vulgare]|uniref:Uncharacterized protein n=1 Tax=Auriscalpium vulgare TaxID=40419 RepID=A0ACB8RDY9_9AGAM|nr:hypothetical protein FA95DRAFT_1564557 [Auriscalpium vulgare]
MTPLAIALCVVVSSAIIMTPTLFDLLSVLVTLLYSALCLALSLLLRTTILSHHLTIARVSVHLRPPSIALHNVQAVFPERSIYPSTTIKFVELRVTPHTPSRAAPKVLTVRLTSALHVSRLSTVSTTQLTAVILIFPVLARLSAGPPVQVTLDGFRLRVFSSTATPYLVQRLREALVSTVLFGEVLRFDDLAADVRFGLDYAALDGPGADKLGAPAQDEDGAETEPEEEQQPGAGEAPEEDDLLVVASTANLQMHDRKGRIYAFTHVCACMRRSWGGFVCARGAYEMEAEGCRWQRFPPVVLGEAGLKELSMWRCIARLPLTLPVDVYTLVTDPMRFIDLVVPRAQIQFDDFRMRDAELVRQGFEGLVRAFMGVPLMPGR